MSSRLEAVRPGVKIQITRDWTRARCTMRSCAGRLAENVVIAQVRECGGLRVGEGVLSRQLGVVRQQGGVGGDDRGFNDEI